MSVYDEHKPQGGNDLYLKLKDGDKVKMRIASQPAISVYREGDKPRYSWVVWNRDQDKAQVYSSGVSVYSQIANLVEEWGEPTEFDVTIRRTGSGLQDTEYAVVPVKTSKDLTAEEKTEVSNVDLPKAIKGKWLADYVKDGELPEPVSDVPRDDAPPPSDKDAPSGYDKARAKADELKGVDIGDDPVDLSAIPY